MQNFDISENLVVSLDKISLRDLRVISLVHLNATSNYISVIDEEAFLRQSKLETVDLSKNSLRNIETKNLICNPSLEILSLSSNQDLRLSEDCPFLYSQSLRLLKLSDRVHSYLPPEAFRNLPVLQEIYILHNKFEVLNSVRRVWKFNVVICKSYLTDGFTV